MPVTPFLGISVFIHLFIILYHRLTHRDSKEGMPLRRIKTAKVQRSFWAFCIFVMVFMMIAINAGILVGASISDKHSSVQVFGHLLAEINTHAPPLNPIVRVEVEGNLYAEGVNGVDATNIALNDS